jgi:hypothetical protein
MNFKLVEESNALAPGCELWLVADLAKSRWSRRIDWALNLQIMKAGRHETARPSDELKKILQEWDEESLFAVPTTDISPLLIASRAYVPAGKTVVVGFEGDAAAWSTNCARVWNNLGQPKVRVFLPDQVNQSAFEKAWKSASAGAKKKSDDSIEEETAPAAVEVVTELRTQPAT